MRPVLQGLKLNGRLKCHIIRLTSVKFITGFLEREWVLMAQKCHSYTVYPCTVLSRGPRRYVSVEMKTATLNGTHKHEDYISAAAVLICLKGLKGKECLLYIYMHDSLFLHVCVAVAASG